jgi:Cdc6-like AAA superfamily ATPase
MAKENAFPRKLLRESKDVRLKYFFEFTIAHPQLIEAYIELLKVIKRSAAATLVFLYGCSGVGKTTLLRRIEKELIENLLPELDKDRNRIPVVVVELVAPGSGVFNWKDFYRRMLLSMDEPLVDHKISYETLSSGPGERVYFRTGARAVTADLRFAVEQTLKRRRPVAVLIDEGQHLAKMASGRKLQDQLDCLKSLSSQTGVRFVIMGTYELLVFRNLSAQLSRRSIDIHFERYSSNKKEDIRGFQSVLLTFQKHLPLKEEPDLLARWDYFYERSIGCIGVLKDWLTAALAEALDDEADCLSDAHLEKYAPSVARSQNMISDAVEGEKILRDAPEELRRLRTRLGLEIESLGSNASRQRALGPAKRAATPKGRKKGRVGRRRAKRDPIGGESRAEQ